MNLHAAAERFYQGLMALWCACMLFWSPGTASAEPGHALEVGIKAWWNEWKKEEPGTPGSLSSGAVLVGPELTAKYNEFLFLRTALLFSRQDYEFSEQFGTNRFERQDAEVAAGFLVVPELAISGGYRRMRLREDETGWEQTLSGPVAGFTAVIQVYRNLTFHMRFDYQFTRLKQEAPSRYQEKSPGWIGELAVGCHFTRKFSGSFGYKSETNKGKDSAVRDIFSGPSVAAFYAF